MRRADELGGAVISVKPLEPAPGQRARGVGEGKAGNGNPEVRPGKSRPTTRPKQLYVGKPLPQLQVLPESHCVVPHNTVVYDTRTFGAKLWNPAVGELCANKRAVVIGDLV